MAEKLTPSLGVVNDNVRRYTNARKGASTRKPIAFRLERGSTCTVLREVRGGGRKRRPWYRVEQNGKRGYAVAHNIDIVHRTGRVNDNVQSFTNARAGAGTDHPVVFEIQRGSTCTILGEVDGKRYRGKPWYFVEQGGRRGYAVAYNIDLVPMATAPLEMPHGPETTADQGIRPDSDFSAKITEHITYGEVTIREEERRFLDQAQCDICLELCLFLEEVRTHFGSNPVTITSGHRPPAVNRRVRGATNSEHLYQPGQGALDFFVENVDVWAVQRYCDAKWPFSLGYGAPKGFVHLGIRPGRPRVRWDY